MDASYRSLASANGINDNVFYARLRYGWPPEKAATVPVRQRVSSLHKIPEPKAVVNTVCLISDAEYEVENLLRNQLREKSDSWKLKFKELWMMFSELDESTQKTVLELLNVLEKDRNKKEK